MYRTADVAELYQAITRHIASAIDALGRETYRRLAELELPSRDSGASSRPLQI